MPKANLYDITGKQKGEVELAEAHLRPSSPMRLLSTPW